jgi:nitrite reductase (NADH) small subunit
LTDSTERVAGSESTDGPQGPARVDVGEEDSFEHGVPRIFTIGNREIGVVRWGEHFYAVRNHCPDQGGPLCAGTIRLPLAAGPADEHVYLSIEEGRPVIACPWHHYEFDLRNGHEVRGGRRAITYQVDVTAGRVYVRTGTAAS